MFVLTVLFSAVICLSFAEYNNDELDKIIERKLAERERVYVEKEQVNAERERVYAERIQKLEETERTHVARERIFEERVKALEAAQEMRYENFSNISKRYLAEVPPSTPIGFTACVSIPDLKTLGAHHTIMFDRAITNRGSGYHPNLGVFEAPLKGLYVFHVTAMTSPGQDQSLAFMRNGVKLNELYPDGRGATAFQTTTGTWVLELDQNAEVYVQTVYAGELHGNCFTTFSGFLLQEVE